MALSRFLISVYRRNSGNITKNTIHQIRNYLFIGWLRNPSSMANTLKNQMCKYRSKTNCFSTQSSINYSNRWSFGVVLWEIFTCGGMPYANWNRGGFEYDM